MSTPATLSFPFDLPLPTVQPLCAGHLTLNYENGNLRGVRLGQVEVVRMIYIAVRDHDWTTAGCRISDEKIKTTADGFDISYTATYALGRVNVFEARVSLTGRTDVVEFAMRGVALVDFSRNRIGICVHHPIRECAGKNAGVSRPDGSSYSAAFPELIAPHQPFLDIQQMTWSPGSGIDATLTFAGDIFETEDQRNWGDACYKTYSTPLSIPFPVQVKKGRCG